MNQTIKPGLNPSETLDVEAATMYMHFWWDITGASAAELDPTIPYAFDIPSSVLLGLTSDKTIPLKDENGDLMANVVISKNSNTGVLHFTEKAAEESDVKGWFYFGGAFNKEEIGNPDDYDFPFVIQGNPTDVTVTFNPHSETDDSEITKDGEAQTDGSIKWTVKFTPKMTPSYSKTAITNAVITDVIASNQELVDPAGLSKCTVSPELDGAVGFSYDSSNQTLTYYTKLVNKFCLDDWH